MKMAALFDDISKEYKRISPVLDHNAVLFNINEGNLLPYVLADLQAQLSEQSYAQIKHRVAPINVLKRMVDKLSTIYGEPPVRDISDNATERDEAGWNQYQKAFDLNTNMAMANSFFNLFKNSLIEPYIQKGQPRLRIIPSDRFFPYSTDRENPTTPTHIVKVMGKVGNIDKSRANKTLLYVYSDEEFAAIDQDGKPVNQVLVQLGNPTGINPYGKLPFVYVNRSKHDLIPQIDTDTLTMTKIFPVLLSDLNFAVMFQAFSVIYGVDLDSENLKMSPNAFWSFKSDPNSNKEPKVGIIKPEVDIDQVLNFITAQLSMWMNSKGIRPGSIGLITKDTFSSGVSKAIDEMDTAEDRQKQIPYFVSAEKELSYLVMNYMHPVWVRYPEFMMGGTFTPGAYIETEFPEQEPMVSMAEITDTEIKKLDKGLQSRRGAIKALNPEWSEEQITALILEIEAEKRVEVEQPMDMEGEMPKSDEDEDSEEMMGEEARMTMSEAT